MHAYSSSTIDSDCFVPLAFLQTFGKNEFLKPVVILLFGLCYSKIISVILSPLIAIIGKHIGDIKFLGIASIWSALSFIQKRMKKEYGKNWEGSLSFEKVKRYLPHFKSAIQLPIYVIGVDL